ncbi:MAG: hypothetical protein HQL63_10370, partial [Magnetococcales bacterium]|nr:hypothetical protein [Magnetococcales bacterium]
MSSFKNSHEVVNPRVVNQLRHGMRQIVKNDGAFGRSVAAWRLHAKLRNILGKKQLPPPDYVLARLANDASFLRERLGDLEKARRFGYDRQADQVIREFDNIGPFERTYGGV